MPAADWIQFSSHKKECGVSAGESLSAIEYCYEYNVTIVPRLARFGNRTETINIPADFVAGDNRVRRDSRDGANKQQTLSRGKDGVRCNSTCDHRFRFGARHQWVGPFSSYPGSGFVLVLLHRFLALTAYYSHGFGILIKGKPAVLVENGKLQRRNMGTKSYFRTRSRRRYAARRGD